MQLNIETVKLLYNAMHKYGEMEIPALGNSMFPFIREGDTCRFANCAGAQLKKGDIVLYHSLTGKLIAHRLYQLKLMNNQFWYIFKGDSNLGLDEPVNEEQLIGKLTSVHKGKYILRTSHKMIILWGELILTLPVLSLLLRKYLNRKEKRRDKCN